MASGSQIVPKVDNRPIGVFDSGIGGLTVLRALLRAFPKESFVYLGDTARLPYGPKSPQTIRKYSEQNLEFLCRQNVKSLVVACGSASTQILESEFRDIPVYTVIGPGAAQALKKSQTQRIGILGTRATISSQAYLLALKARNPFVHVASVACPLFVPLVEEGWELDPLTNLIVYRYLAPLTQENLDTLILGCTHYPLLAQAISRVMGPQVTLIDTGESVAEQMAPHLIPASPADLDPASPQVRFCVTDESSQFQFLAERILGPNFLHSLELVTL